MLGFQNTSNCIPTQLCVCECVFIRVRHEVLAFRYHQHLRMWEKCTASHAEITKSYNIYWRINAIWKSLYEHFKWSFASNWIRNVFTILIFHFLHLHVCRLTMEFEQNGTWLSTGIREYLRMNVHWNMKHETYEFTLFFGECNHFDGSQSLTFRESAWHPNEESGFRIAYFTYFTIHVCIKRYARIVSFNVFISAALIKIWRIFLAKRATESKDWRNCVASWNILFFLHSSKNLNQGFWIRNA